MSDNPESQDRQSSRSSKSSAQSTKSAEQEAALTQGAAQGPSPTEPTRSPAGPQSRAETDQTQTPELPPVGMDHIKKRLGADINAYGLELARRVLGELHIAALGGAPASDVSQEAAGQLEDGDASFWNERGKELAQREFAGLNQRGSMIGTPDTDVPENPPEAYAAAGAPQTQTTAPSGQSAPAPAAAAGTEARPT